MASGARQSLKTEPALTGVVYSLNCQFANYTNIEVLDDSYWNTNHIYTDIRYSNLDQFLCEHDSGISQKHENLELISKHKYMYYYILGQHVIYDQILHTLQENI